MATKFKYFISLKWKAVLLLSMVLLLANGALAILFYRSTIGHLEQQQNKNLVQQNRELQSLLFADKAQLQGLAEILSLILSDTNQEGSLEDNLLSMFKSHGEQINATWGVEKLIYYATNGDVLFQWYDQKYSETIKQLALDVIAKEQPNSLLLCFSYRCDHVVAIPVLSNQQKVNSLILSRSLSDVLFNFIELTEAEITLIVASSSQNSFRDLAKGIALSSHKADVINLFNSLTKSQYELFKNNGKLRINFENEWFEIHEFIALKGRDEMRFIVTNRVTDLINNIENTVFSSFFIGLMGFLLSGLSLLILLWYPVTRLQRVTKSLPLLAEGKFLKFRKTLKQQQLQRIAADEIDIVEDNIISASEQLEQYQVEKQQQAHALKKERDFVTKLIEGAPVIILSQTFDHVITQINQQGIEFSHIKKVDLLGESFLNTFVNSDTAKFEITNFKLWVKSDVGVYQHELKMTTFDGASKVVHWTHSKHNDTNINDTIVLSIGLDLSERIEAEENLSWLASHDSLTELTNRRFFENSFETILKQHIRHEYSGSLLFFDLDQFKYVNDVSGHHSGDGLLKLVAAKILTLIRSQDVFARLGGDEFAIILPETDKKESINVANKILEALAITSLKVEGYNHKVSASIGIAFFPEHGEDIMTLMAHADIAMYQAKYSGRGRWYLYTAEDKAQELLSSHAYWREKIYDALANNKFILHFQPILNVKENKIHHYEALIRMKGEGSELIYPDNFIPIAEQTGQIQAIDLWVVNCAFDFLKNNPEISLAINLSSSAITNRSLVSLIEGLLLKNKIIPERVIFEITETAVVENLILAVSIMNEIRALGCQFSLDDFGTGFSSFSYLKQLPVDIIKIDGSFVQDLVTSKEDRLFVKAINDISIGLAKKTVAEYVESGEILMVLKDIGVDYAQGYFIGKPKAGIL